MESSLICKIEFPKKFYCTRGDFQEIYVYNDKVLFGDKEILYKSLIAVRPAKERDGFYIEFKDASLNPYNNIEDMLSFHFRTTKFFKKEAAKKFGMSVYSILFNAVTEHVNSK